MATGKLPDLIEELEHRLSQAANPAQQVDARLDLAREIAPRNPERAASLAREALLLAEDYQLEPLRKAEAAYQAGVGCLQMADYLQAQKFFEQAELDISTTQHHTLRARIYNGMAVTALQTGRYAESLSNFLRALRIFQNTASPYRSANILNNIGQVYLRLADPRRAQPYVEDSLRIAREVVDYRAQANALRTQCWLLTETGDEENALRTGLEALHLYRQVENRRGEAETLNTLGNLFLRQNQLPIALDYYQQALDIASAIHSRTEMSSAFLGLGSTLLRMGKLQKARQTLQNGLDLADEIGAHDMLLESHRQLAEVEKRLGHARAALAHYEWFDQFRSQRLKNELDARTISLEILQEVENARRDAEAYHLQNVALQQELAAHEQVIEDLDAFTHMVAHDLKNPIQHQMLAARLLSARFADQLGDEGKGYLTTMIHAAEKMSAMVDELLVLANVRQRSVSLVAVEMGSVVGEVLVRLKEDIAGYDAVIELPEQWPPAQGYAPWLEEVWVNYISNAMKYGGRPPVVTLGAAPAGEQWVRFWVKDNGDGIDRAQLGSLFTPFTRLSGTEGEGYGLGLSIVRRIIEKLGGQVSVESSGQPGEGTTFSFLLPAIKA